MSSRFVVLTGNTTPYEDLAISGFVKNRFGWWHWLPNSWLIVDPHGKLTAQSLRSDLHEIAPNAQVIVLEFTPTGDTWAGQAPPNWFDWFRETWEQSK